MTVRYIVGDVRAVLRSLPDGSVNSVITSPPYLGQRGYLPGDHPDKAKEIGQEKNPGAFLATLLALTDELWRVVADDGTIWFNLGDKLSGSGGAGGDYADGGAKAGQPKFGRVPAGGDWPRAKSVCWTPELFGASLAYGRNLLTGEPCQQWITRPSVVWCKPHVMPGRTEDRFRTATELIVWASKRTNYYFDLDAIRVPHAEHTVRYDGQRGGGPKKGNADRADGGEIGGKCHPLGAPPFNWWVVPFSPFAGAHFATFPPELIRRPVIASCPPGGVILDLFAGTGTTLMVAAGHGRDAIGIDVDERNAELARGRLGWLLSDVEVFRPEAVA